MKIVCLSDTHGLLLDDLPKGDCLIHAGDFTNKGDLKEICEFVEWFSSFPHKIKIAVPGNHDFNTNSPAIRLLFENADIHLLVHESLEVAGWKVFGSPYTPEFMNWAYMVPKDRIGIYWETIPDDTQILITHGPAYGIRDRCQRGRNLGCESLASRLDTLLDLRVHMFGHIHTNTTVSRCEVINKKLFVNASILDESYRILNKPFVFELTKTNIRHTDKQSHIIIRD
jgi:Icc-related predicted phosphoesterase